MTISYALGVQPKWYLVDNSGKPTAGFMYTYSNLNPTDYKPVYQDASGNFPYTQPVRFDANGTTGPIYFKFDSDNPTELYYLSFYDENNNFLYDINDYSGGTGGGGGSVTTAINLKNYAGNNIYEYNIGSTSALGASIPSNTVLAPSNHMNFIDPDIRFINNDVGGTDSISFPEFTFGSNPLTTDVTPQYYLEYKCTAGGSETSKYIQFPVQPKVTTLDAQIITVTLWARCISGSDQITIRTKQFFGTPTPSVTPSIDNYDSIGAPITLTSSWVRYSVSGTISGVSGKTISPTGDDALYLTIELPHGLATTIDITKVSMYIGSSAPASDFNSFQQIEGLIETPRTGDVKSGMQYASYIPKGWLIMGNTNIGDASSGATYNNSNSPNIWFLFNIIWNTTTNTQCQLYAQSSGTPIARGSTAQADWDIHSILSLPNNVGAVISNIGNGHVTGDFGGQDSVTLSLGQIPDHIHNDPGHAFILDQTGTRVTPSGGLGNTGTTTGSIAGYPGSTPVDVRQPTTYIPYIIKL